MDLAFTEKDIAFRDEVRAFIDEAFDKEMREHSRRSSNGYLPKDDHVRWQKRLNEKGWMVPNWPQEHGGPGWDPTQRFIYETEMASAGAPHVLPFGPRMVAPVIMKFGSPEQKNRFLPAILNSEIIFCQGYSEPGSGSDLASLQMKAEDKGDHYLCNGSKIWTSVAQYADWIFCLVRTSKEAKRQDGISFLLIDMKTPGIQIDPIVTVDLPEKGFQEVNQVFFTDVKVPKENRIGEEGKGWTYAKYLLEFERGNAYAGGLKRGLRKLKTIAKAERSDGATPLIEDETFRQRIAKLEIEIEALEMTELRILSKLAGGQNMGPESSQMKLRGSELQQAVTELVLDAVGLQSVPFPPMHFGSNEEPVGPAHAEGVAARYANMRKTSIYAGSNEVQHNILAKLVLGL
ncbi:MAG: acyl-CoA dehydrogenase family protein [Sneathiellaceae bacterium]